MSILPLPDLTPLIKGLAILCAAMIPLALWKVVDIAIWVIRHVDIAFR